MNWMVRSIVLSVLSEVIGLYLIAAAMFPTINMIAGVFDPTVQIFLGVVISVLGSVPLVLVTVKRAAAAHKNDH